MIRYLVVLCMLVGCSSTKQPSNSERVTALSENKEATNWHGLPTAPGLPPKLAALSFGMDRSLMTGEFAGLLSEKGVVLSPKATAKAKLSADGTLRYLTVFLQASEGELTAKWPKGDRRLIDNRHSALVWYLPKRSVQIQLKTTNEGLALTYLRVTPLESLVGIPSDAGNTFASLIGKSMGVTQRLFVRTERSQDGRSTLAWAAPLLDETVSLKAAVRQDPQTKLVVGIDVFLKDDEHGTLKSRLESVVKKSWLPAETKDSYINNEVTLRFGHIQRLSRRKRANYPFTLHLSARPPELAPTP